MLERRLNFKSAIRFLLCSRMIPATAALIRGPVIFLLVVANTNCERPHCFICDRGRQIPRTCRVRESPLKQCQKCKTKSANASEEGGKPGPVRIAGRAAYHSGKVVPSGSAMPRRQPENRPLLPHGRCILRFALGSGKV
jgi:hypothetical protein